MLWEAQDTDQTVIAVGDLDASSGGAKKRQRSGVRGDREFVRRAHLIGMFYEDELPEVVTSCSGDEVLARGAVMP
jgi:hypothetical protein